MKRAVFIILICSVSLLLVQSEDGSEALADTPCRREYLVTPEPGTCLQLKVYRFLQAIERFEENPVDTKGGKKLLNILEPRVKLQIDTFFTYDTLQIPIRIYYPNKKTLEQSSPVVLFIHGGGFIAGSLDQYDMTVKKLAKVTDRIYVSVGYRLAPEHPYPAAVNDTYAAWQWLTGNVDDLNGDPERMYIMGSSAGANLATVVTLRCRDEGFAMPDAQMLFYPPTTFRETSFPSRRYFTSDDEKSYLLTEAFVRKSKTAYLAGYIDETDPYLSPLDADLDASLPPALIQTAQCDPLRDDGKRYAEALRKAGVTAEYKEYSGMIHGFLSFWMFFNEGKESMKAAMGFMDEHS